MLVTHPQLHGFAYYTDWCRPSISREDELTVVKELPQKSSSPNLYGQPLIRLLGREADKRVAVIAPASVTDRANRMAFGLILGPSAFNWRFAIAASTTGRPGITRMDALDLLRVMRSAMNYWRREIREPIREVGLLGYSLGGLQAAFVAHAWDPRAMGLSLRRVLLINFPIDLRYGTRRLDAFYAMHSRFGPKKARRLKHELSRAALVYVTDHDIKDPGYFEDLDTKFAFTRDELKFGIGLLYREVLAKVKSRPEIDAFLRLEKLTHRSW